MAWHQSCTIPSPHHPGITQGEITDFTASEHAENNPKNTMQPPGSICAPLELPVTPGFPPRSGEPCSGGAANVPKQTRQRGKEKASKGHAGEGSKFPLGWAARGSVVYQQRLPLPVTLKGVAKKIHFPHPEWKAKKKKRKKKDICSLERFMFPLQKLSRGPGSARCRC